MDYSEVENMLRNVYKRTVQERNWEGAVACIDRMVSLIANQRGEEPPKAAFGFTQQASQFYVETEEEDGDEG